MAPYFSENQLAQLYNHRQEIVGKYIRSQFRWQLRKYTSDRGREYAFHGFGRRLGILVRAIDEVFTVLPPERESIPEREDLENTSSFPFPIARRPGNARVFIFRNFYRRP
jgi:hypothetical protein